MRVRTRNSKKFKVRGTCSVKKKGGARTRRRRRYCFRKCTPRTKLRIKQDGGLFKKQSKSVDNPALSKEREEEIKIADRLSKERQEEIKIADRLMPDLKKYLTSKISEDDVHSDIDNYYNNFDNQMVLNEFSTRVAEEEVKTK